MVAWSYDLLDATTKALYDYDTVRAPGGGILGTQTVVPKQEAEGDMEKAVEILRKKGYARAKDKAHRSAGEGAIGAYIHTNGKIGVLVGLEAGPEGQSRSRQHGATQRLDHRPVAREALHRHEAGRADPGRKRARA